MDNRIGTGGEVVIPEEMRSDLGLEPGTEVIIERDGDHLVIRAARLRPPLRGRFSGSRLTEMLEADRAGC